MARRQHVLAVSLTERDSGPMLAMGRLALLIVMRGMVNERFGAAF
jgi:hypothetical protein